MNAASPIRALYGRTADEHLAALVGDNAYLALPAGQRRANDHVLIVPGSL